MAPARPKGQGNVTQLASLVSIFRLPGCSVSNPIAGQLANPFCWGRRCKIFVNVYNFRLVHVTLGEDFKLILWPCWVGRVNSLAKWSQKLNLLPKNFQQSTWRLPVCRFAAFLVCRSDRIGKSNEKETVAGAKSFSNPGENHKCQSQLKVCIVFDFQQPPKGQILAKGPMWLTYLPGDY